MLLEAARRTQGIAAKPPPFVLQTALGDFAVTYELNVGCDDPHRMAELYTALHRNILDVFNEYDVAIMTPGVRRGPVRAEDRAEGEVVSAAGQARRRLPGAAAPRRGPHGHSRARESSQIVTGPSLTSCTCMCAPNTPVGTGLPEAAASAPTNAANAGSAISGAAAAVYDGRLPLRVDA